MPVTPVHNHAPENDPVRRVLPGDTGEDPFAAFDAKRALTRRVEPPTAAEVAEANAAQALTHERGKTHGEFRDHASFTQHLKDAMRSFVREDGSHPWEGLTPAMKESLDMNMHKIGRILAGRADFKDHWSDMAGYSQLVADRLPD